MSRRHGIQRSNRVRLKADCHALLQAVLVNGSGQHTDEIREMMVRLKPPTGAAAPIVLTGYTQMGKDGKVRTTLARGKASLSVVLENGSERFLGMLFGFEIDDERYRKD